MLETPIETKVCKHAKKHGVVVYKFKSPSRRGVPDRIYFFGGRVWCIEFKATGKKATELQQLHMDLIEAAGTPCYVIDDVDDGYRLINELVQGNVIEVSRK